MHLGHGIGIAALIGAIAFAFGQRTAQVIVGLGLLVGAALIAYVAVLIVAGAI